MGLFGRKKYDENGFDKDGYDVNELDEDGFNKYQYKNGFHKHTGIHTQTGTKIDEDGWDMDGYDLNGFDKDGYGKNGFSKNGWDKDGFDNDGWNQSGWNKSGYNKLTGTLHDEDRYTKNGLDENGFNKSGFNISTGTKIDEFGWNKDGLGKDGFDKGGFDKGGFDEEGLHKDTRTKFDTNEFDKGGFNVNGHDQDGFDVNGYHPNGKHKTSHIQTTASIDSKQNKPKLFLDSVSGDVHFNMIAFQGEEKFAKMVSGGNFDFYDNDAPAYILNIKFDEINKNLQDTLIGVIRRTFPKKFQIFPSNYSIGAYWINDLITEENASYYLRRIIENYLSR